MGTAESVGNENVTVLGEFLTENLNLSRVSFHFLATLGDPLALFFNVVANIFHQEYRASGWVGSGGNGLIGDTIVDKCDFLAENFFKFDGDRGQGKFRLDTAFWPTQMRQQNDRL